MSKHLKNIEKGFCLIGRRPFLLWGRFISFLLLLFLNLTVVGQEMEVEVIDEDTTSYRVYFAEPSFSIFLPQGNFHRVLDSDINYGFSYAMLFQLQTEKPMFAGFDLYYGHIDSHSTEWDGFFDNGDPAEFESTVNSSFVGVNGIIRYYPDISIWIIEAYMEGSFGIKWFNTYQSTTSYFEGTEEDSDVEFVENDISLTYGAAVGLQLALTNNIYFNTKLNYLPGLSVQYDVQLPDSEIQNIQDPIQAFEQKQSRSDVVMINGGLTFVF